MSECDIDIVVVNYKRYDLMKRFLDSFYEYEPKTPYTLTVFDNEANLSDGLDFMLDYPNARLLSSEENLGYSGACNISVSKNDSKYIGLFNNDMEFINNTCIDKCVEYLDNTIDVGIVGPLQYSSQGKVTHGGIFGTHDAPKHREFGSKNIDKCRDVKEAVTVSGSAYLTKRKVWEEMQNCEIYMRKFPEALGAFAPFRHFFEETLYSYHAYAHGYKSVYLGSAELIHEWHQSSEHGSQTNNFKEGQKLFREFCDDHGMAHD